MDIILFLPFSWEWRFGRSCMDCPWVYNLKDACNCHQSSTCTSWDYPQDSTNWSVLEVFKDTAITWTLRVISTGTSTALSWKSQISIAVLWHMIISSTYIPTIFYVTMRIRIYQIGHKWWGQETNTSKPCVSLFGCFVQKMTLIPIMPFFLSSSLVKIHTWILNVEKFPSILTREWFWRLHNCHLDVCDNIFVIQSGREHVFSFLLSWLYYIQRLFHSKWQPFGTE